MMKSLMLAAAFAAAPIAAIAQGVPPPVTTDTMRTMGTAQTDAIRMNQQLIERERQQREAAQPAQPQPPQPPEPQAQPQPQQMPPSQPQVPPGPLSTPTPASR